MYLTWTAWAAAYSLAFTYVRECLISERACIPKIAATAVQRFLSCLARLSLGRLSSLLCTIWRSKRKVKWLEQWLQTLASSISITDCQLSCPVPDVCLQRSLPSGWERDPSSQHWQRIYAELMPAILSKPRLPPYKTRRP